MNCELCKENKMDVKEYQSSIWGPYGLCTPCARNVFDVMRREDRKTVKLIDEMIEKGGK